MLSAAYQRSSVVARDAARPRPREPLARTVLAAAAGRRRVRDAMLFVSGRLDRTPGGPAADDLDTPRRSLYVQTARWDRSSFAMLFDAANPDASTEKRTVSTVAPQALCSSTIRSCSRQARHLAERLVREVPGDDNARIERAYQLLFGRPARAGRGRDLPASSWSGPDEPAGRGRLAGPCPRSAVQQRVCVRGLSRQACEDHSHVGANQPLPARFPGASRQRLRPGGARGSAGGPGVASRGRRARPRGQPLRRPGPSPSADREALHLPLHAGRAVARRPVRSQAEGWPR